MRFVIEKNNCFVGIVDVFIVNLQVEVYERMPVSSRCHGIKPNANCKIPYRKAVNTNRNINILDTHFY